MKPHTFCILIGFILIAGCAREEGVSGEYPKVGLASWYWATKTASGEKFNSNALTCAMRNRDFGKYYEVCNLINDECVVVRHNDFGPSKVMYKQSRIIDLSQAAFLRIADLKDGIIKVAINEVKAPDR